MISFVLNNEFVSSDKPTGSSLLDFIRYDMDLPGTKTGCREGDCGACTVIEGTLVDGKVIYKSIVSCLTPIGNVHGKHIVTIEGINLEHLSPVQKAITDKSATQCGFCTPGVIMSLMSLCLSGEKHVKEKAITSVSGNICRCTGYKSIELASEEVSELLKDKNTSDPAAWLVENKFLPDYFLSVAQKLAEITPAKNEGDVTGNLIIAGGTDLMVKRADELAGADLRPFFDRNDLKGIFVGDGNCTIGASCTISDIAHSPLINETIPGFAAFLSLVASEQVRNMSTVAGNIVNASPAADPAIMLLALESSLNIDKSGHLRSIQLKEFYAGYKKVNMENDEFIRSISFSLPEKPVLFNFEKVSRRTHLDIASVNSAILVRAEGDRILQCSLSAGGVSPVPLFLKRSSSFLEGKLLTPVLISEAVAIIQDEISPISDIRGSSNYKRLLMRQLFFAHFIELFPGLLNVNDITK
jgi:xanthine dehydrogenase small subunit